MKRMQYTIRAVPEHVDQALRQKAERENKSLNAVLLEVLEHAAFEPVKPALHHDLDFLFGTWVEDPEFDEAIKDQRKIDWEMWQ